MSRYKNCVLLHCVFTVVYTEQMKCQTRRVVFRLSLAIDVKISPAAKLGKGKFDSVFRVTLILEQVLKDSCSQLVADFP